MYPKVATPYDQNPARLAIVANSGKRAKARPMAVLAKLFGIHLLMGLLARGAVSA